MKLTLLHRCLVGGLTDIGLTADGGHVLVVSHNGRGVFEMATGTRVARDPESPSQVPWLRQDAGEVDGIGAWEGEVIHTVGLFTAATPDNVMAEIQQVDPENQVTEFRAALVSVDGARALVGFSDELRIYERCGQSHGEATL